MQKLQLYSIYADQLKRLALWHFIVESNMDDKKYRRYFWGREGCDLGLELTSHIPCHIPSLTALLEQYSQAYLQLKMPENREVKMRIEQTGKEHIGEEYVSGRSISVFFSFLFALI